MKRIKNSIKKFKTFFRKKIRKFKKFWMNASFVKKVAFVLSSIVILASFGVTFGRYAYIEVRDLYFASKNFYFNSDKLDVKLARYQVDNWSGAEDYPIKFNMDSYKNNNVFSTSDISYDITYRCSSNVICSIDKTEGVITASKHVDSFTVIIEPNAIFEDGDTAWLEVDAHSTAPYEKTLSGRFVLKIGKIGTTYEIVDKVGSPYFDLNITNTLDYYIVEEEFGDYDLNQRLDINTYLGLSDENKAKCTSVFVNLNFDPEVTILDMTNEKYLSATDVRHETLRDGFEYVNGISFKVDALSSVYVRFYKSDTTQNYTYPFVNSSSIVDVTYG